jgi:RNA polymerase sigma-70 factor (ECF subfamily)
MSARPSDGQLIVELQSGNLDALGVLYERHKTNVYRTALAITRDPARAEDILQDCFLRLHRYAHNVDSSLPLKPWLYRVTTNLAYNSERRGKRWQTSLDGILDWLACPPHHSPELQAEVSDVRSEVLSAIASLNINQRVVIILFYLNSLSVKETAQILGCPVGTVKSRLYHGRENLRRKLEARRKTFSELAYAPV